MPHGLFTTRNICYMGLLLCIFLVLRLYVNINVPGVMKIGFSWIISIYFVINFGFILGIFFNCLGDTLAKILSGTIHQWMWEYFMINIFLAIICSAMMLVIKMQSDKKFAFNNATMFIFFILSTIIGLLTRVSSLNTSTYNYVYNTIVYIIIGIQWLSFFTINILYFTLFRKKKELFNRSFDYLSIFVTVYIVHVTLSWFYGTWAYEQYLRNVLLIPVNKNYLYYLVPRVAKSIFLIPLESFVIYALFKSVKVINDKKTKWGSEKLKNR